MHYLCIFVFFNQHELNITNIIFIKVKMNSKQFIYYNWFIKKMMLIEHNIFTINNLIFIVEFKVYNMY